MHRFQPWLRRWELRPDGPAFGTRNSDFLPVVWRRRAAMLRVTFSPEKQAGGRVLAWWRGGGAADVLAIDGPALLMARGGRAEGLIWRAVQDDEGAIRILCTVAARLHAPRGTERLPPEGTPSLAEHFRHLLSPRGRAKFPVAARHADALLAEPEGPSQVLHGDLHHTSALPFGPGDWRAIDPAGLIGERAFDYVPMLFQPDLADPSLEIAANPATFHDRLTRIAGESGIDAERLRLWASAYGALVSLEEHAANDPSRARADVATRISDLAATGT